MERALDQYKVQATESSLRYQLLKERVLKKYRGRREEGVRVQPPPSRAADSVFQSLEDLISVGGFIEEMGGAGPSRPADSVGSQLPRPGSRRPREDEGSSQRCPREGTGEGEGERDE
jgi:hypothetical protein